MCGGKDRLRFVMPPDLEKYRPYVDGFDLSEAQKAELIHSVWAIMESFADRAFGLHPVQRVALSGSGEDLNGRPDRVSFQQDSVKSHFRNAARLARRQKGIDHEGG